jgi:hypothetical protein
VRHTEDGKVARFGEQGYAVTVSPLV